MWELDHKEGWALKNGCFWTVVLEKTLESSLDCKEIKPVHPKGNQSWIFIGWTDCWSWSSNTLATWCKELTHLKRRWKTIPFRYDLNQISYIYTVEVTNRFKESDLIDRVPEELWTEVRDIVQEAMIKTNTKEKVSFHSNPKERQCQQMFKLLHNCTHLTR